MYDKKHPKTKTCQKYSDNTQADKTLEKTRLNMFTFRNNAVST